MPDPADILDRLKAIISAALAPSGLRLGRHTFCYCFAALDGFRDWLIRQNAVPAACYLDINTDLWAATDGASCR